MRQPHTKHSTRIRRLPTLEPRPDKPLRITVEPGLFEHVRAISQFILYPLAAIVAIVTFGQYMLEADERETERALLNLEAKLRADEVLARLPRPDHPGAKVELDDLSRSTADAVHASLLSTGYATIGTTEARLECATGATLHGELYIGSYSTEFTGCDISDLGLIQNFIGQSNSNSVNGIHFSDSDIRSLRLGLSGAEHPSVLTLRDSSLRRTAIKLDATDTILLNEVALQDVVVSYSGETSVFVLQLPDTTANLEPLKVIALHQKYCPVWNNESTDPMAQSPVWQFSCDFGAGVP